MKAKLYLALALATVTSIASGGELRSDAANAPTKIAPKAAKPGKPAAPAPRTAPAGKPAAPMLLEPRGVKDDKSILCACVRRRNQA